MVIRREFQIAAVLDSGQNRTMVVGLLVLLLLVVVVACIEGDYVEAGFLAFAALLVALFLYAFA